MTGGSIKISFLPPHSRQRERERFSLSLLFFYNLRNSVLVPPISNLRDTAELSHILFCARMRDVHDAPPDCNGLEHTRQIKVDACLAEALLLSFGNGIHCCTNVCLVLLIWTGISPVEKVELVQRLQGSRQK